MMINLSGCVQPQTLFVVSLQDLLGGMAAQPANTHSSATPLQPSTSPSQPPPASKPSSQPGQSEPLKAIVIPPKHSSGSLPFGSTSIQPHTTKPPPVGSTGYTPPPVRPQAQKQSNSTSGLGPGDLDFLSGLGTGSKTTTTPSSATGSSGWSSNMLAQTSSTGMTGQAGLQPKGGSSTASLFSGMQTSSTSRTQPPLQPTSAGMFAGMQVSQAQPSSSGTFNRQSVPPSFQAHQQPLQPQPVMGPLGGGGGGGGGSDLLGTQSGLPQPLLPTQVQGGNGRGWGQGGGQVGQQQELQSRMGWSPAIGGSSQVSGGMGGGLGGGLGTGSGWSSNIAGRGDAGTFGGGNQVYGSGQPTAAGLLMEGGSMLTPMAGGTVPQAMSAGAYYQQPSQQSQSYSSAQPAPGDNPFADLTFLSS